ncbi:MAG TPA: hypothetical protein VN132_02670, partial [Bdellovibrio sp.]|nr:hypothetical protein [Bdellovibrio sp.]
MQKAMRRKIFNGFLLLALSMSSFSWNEASANSSVATLEDVFADPHALTLALIAPFLNQYAEEHPENKKEIQRFFQTLVKSVEEYRHDGSWASHFYQKKSFLRCVANNVFIDATGFQKKLSEQLFEKEFARGPLPANEAGFIFYVVNSEEIPRLSHRLRAVLEKLDFLVTTHGSYSKAALEEVRFILAVSQPQVQQRGLQSLRHLLVQPKINALASVMGGIRDLAIGAGSPTSLFKSLPSLVSLVKGSAVVDLLLGTGFKKAMTISVTTHAGFLGTSAAEMQLTEQEKKIVSGIENYNSLLKGKDPVNYRANLPTTAELIYEFSRSDENFFAEALADFVVLADTPVRLKEGVLESFENNEQDVVQRAKYAAKTFDTVQSIRERLIFRVEEMKNAKKSSGEILNYLKEIVSTFQGEHSNSWEMLSTLIESGVGNCVARALLFTSVYYPVLQKLGLDQTRFALAEFANHIEPLLLKTDVLGRSHVEPLTVSPQSFVGLSVVALHPKVLLSNFIMNYGNYPTCSMYGCQVFELKELFSVPLESRSEFVLFKPVTKRIPFMDKYGVILKNRNFLVHGFMTQTESIDISSSFSSHDIVRGSDDGIISLCSDYGLDSLCFGEDRSRPFEIYENERPGEGSSQERFTLIGHEQAMFAELNLTDLRFPKDQIKISDFSHVDAEKWRRYVQRASFFRHMLEKSDNKAHEFRSKVRRLMDFYSADQVVRNIEKLFDSLVWKGVLANPTEFAGWLGRLEKMSLAERQSQVFFASSALRYEFLKGMERYLYELDNPGLVNS